MQRSRLSTSFWGRLVLLGLSLALGAPALLAQAPPNDNFASATVLVGPSGTVNGSNIGATLEAGEPSITGNPGGESIWYVWTAPADMTVTFNTFGSDFDTLLGAYAGTSLAALTYVADNDNYGSGLQSSLTFTATSNSVYYIKVDGFNAGAGYGASQGSVVLNWGSSISVGLQAGDFRFTSSYYLSSDYDTSWQPPLDPRGEMLSVPAHMTITREHGSAGKVQVTYAITNGFYTNWFTNYLYGTNIYSTNIVYDTNLNQIVASQTTFTNILSTNWFTFSEFEDLQFDIFQYLEEIDLTNFTVTNANGVLVPPNGLYTITNDLPPGTLPPDCTSFPGSFWVSNAVSVTLANTNWVETNYTYTEIYCMQQPPVEQIIPSAVDGVDYTSGIGTTNFDDYQMSADVIVDMLPPSFPFQEGSIPRGIGFYINRYLVGTILNVALDPLESSTIGAPTASTQLTNAVLNVLNEDTADISAGENSPHLFDSGRLATNYFNFERATIRCTRNVGGTHQAVIYVYRQSLDYSAGTSVNYRIDHLKGPPTDNGNNIFPEAPDEIPLQAGSEYATPPGSAAYGTNPDFDSVTGQLQWGAFDGTPKPITIDITNYNDVEFNEDLLVELYFPDPQPTDRFLGNVHYCVLTILFDNERGDAQPAGAVDRMHNMDDDSSTLPHPYNLHPGANSTVYAVAVQPDGKSVIGGDFSAYDTEVRNRIARMNANGLLDTTFNPPGGADQFVSCLAIDPAGNVVAGGAFNSMNGINSKGVARLLPNGTSDTSFSPGAGASDIVWALAFQTNSIIVAGQFTYFNNLPASFIARLSPAGVFDQSFVPNIDGPIQAVAVQPDGKILIGGDFLTVNGTPRTRLARLNANGSLDTSFDPGYGFDNTVYTIVLQPDGRILAGGSFQYVGAQSRNSIARLNTNGSVDQTFDPGDGANDTIYSINIQPDGGIIACGVFSAFNQVRRNTMVRLFANGVVDTSFMDTAYNQFAGLPTHYWDPNAETRNFIYSSALQPDGNLMIAGGFHRVGGGWTRDDVRYRENVCRIIGGATPGPGNMSFAYNSISADQFSDQVFVTLNRQNGTLGPATVTVGPSSVAPGPGVGVDGQDFSFNPIYANPVYITSWARPTWQLQDGTFGQNQANAQTIEPGTTIPNPADKVFINILDNTNVSGNRSFNMKLSHPSGTDLFYLGGQNIPLGFALGSDTATLNILDYHNLPGTLGFSAPTYVVGEGGTNAIITVTRTNGLAGLVSIHFATANGSATNNIHYYATNGILTFLPGITNQSFAVKIIDENIVDYDHTVRLNLFAPSGGATGGLTNAVLTIVDNDVRGGYVQFNSPLMGTNLNGPFAIYGTNENAVYAAAIISRNGSGAGLLSAQLAVTNGTAINGYNFTGFTNTLTWVDGDVRPKVVPIRLFDDGVVETTPLTVNLTLSATTLNGQTNSQSLGSPQFGVLYITNSDFPGQLAFSTPVYAVNNSGGPAIITVVRTGGNAGAATVNFATLPGTSTPGVDFTPTNGVLYFGPGEVSKSFAVQVMDTGLPETPRFVTLQLSGGTPAGILGAPSTAILNIVNSENFNNPPGGLDPTVNPAFGFNDAVHALIQQPDGKFLAGGDFTQADGLPRQRIARLNTDFSLDTGFSSVLSSYGAGGSVLGLVCQSDLRILVCGLFTNFNSFAQNYVTRLNADGTLDSTFNIGSAADNPVYSMAETFVGPDRKVLLAGAFLHFNGQPANFITRLNNNGSPDNNFQPGSGPNGPVQALVVQPDGKIVIGGDFTSFNGVARVRIARLYANGSLDLSFDPGAGANDSVRSIAVQSDGRILMGGVFTNINGVALNHLARLNGDGSVDNTFTPGLGANDLVSSITVQPDTRIVLGGQFTLFNGVTRRGITRLNNDGTLDTMINFGLGANSYVAATLFQTNAQTGMIVLAGAFTTYDNQPAQRIARIFGGSIDGAGTIQFDVPYYEVAEDGTNITVNVRRYGGTTGIVSTDFNTSDNSAIAGVNYLPVMTNLVFASGEVLQTVTIPVLRDYAITTNLWANLNLSNFQPPLPAGPTIGNIPTATLIIDNVDSGVSFSSPTYAFAENDPSGFALINVIRTGSTIEPAAVNFYTLTNGSAIAFTNYVPVTNTVTFAAGQASNFVTVPLIHTLAAEGNTTVPLLLSNANNALLLTPSTATLTIIDVDRYPGQFVFAQTNFVVNESAGLAVLTLIRTNGHTGSVTVQYATSDGTAAAGFNYVATNGIVSFADGETVKNIAVPLIETTQVTGNTAFQVNLSNPGGGATILTPSTAVTIVDDHVGIAFSSPIYIVTETDGSVILGVNRIGTNGSTSFSYATTNGSAIAGTNYVASSGTLTFVPGESFKTFPISVLHDPRVTGPLSFTVGLFNPTFPARVYANNPATVTINDADPGFAFTNANFYTVKSGTNVTISVVRSNANTGTVSVNFATADGTAIAGVDYVATNGLLTFSNGIALKSFNVPIINSRQVAGDRTFSVYMVNPSPPAQLVPPYTASVTITDNLSGLSFSSPVYSVNENGVSATITVMRTGYTNSTVSVNYATADGTGNNGINYVGTSGTLVFSNGVTVRTFSVLVIDDDIVNGDKTVLLALSNPTGNVVFSGPSAATLTIRETDGSEILSAGTALTYESGPVNGAIDPGERVSILFAFRNAAGSNTTSLVATLLATNGVASPSAAQNYGVLIAHGPSAYRPFSFTANVTNGQVVTATFQLVDNNGPTNYLAVPFVVGQSSATFSNLSYITINDYSNATPYPSIINVTALPGLVSKVSVTYSNLSHTWPSDIDSILVAPGGESTHLMTKVGSSFSVNNVTLTFDDTAASLLPSTSQILSGTYRPTCFGSAITFPAPAPPGPYQTNLATFNLSNPNGNWSLYVLDDRQLNSGNISNGWVLHLSTSSPILGNADLALGMTAAPNPVVTSSNLTVSLTLTNFGPSSASNITVNNPLPPSTAYVSSSPSVGQAGTNAAGLFTWTIPSLAVNGTASLTLVLQPSAIGLLTNSATVISSADVNPDDATATVYVTVGSPTADLALGMSGGPDPVVTGNFITYYLSITNLGPATASTVTLADTLPPGVSFVSASPAGYTVSGGQVAYTNLGNLGAGSRLSASIVVQPYAGGLVTNAAVVGSAIVDPSKLNNNAAVKILVEPVFVGAVRSGGNLVISWTADASNYSLETTSSLTPPVVWTAVPIAPVVSGGVASVTIPVGNGIQYFRLNGQAQ